MATDAGAKQPRAATRSARAERKEPLEAAPSDDSAAAAAHETAASDDKDAAGTDKAAAAAAAPSDEPEASTASATASGSATEQTAARRSGRRAAATASGTPSPSAEAEKSAKETGAEESKPGVAVAAAAAAGEAKEGDVSDASTETASDSDIAATDKRNATKRAVREDESAAASTRAAKVAKDLVATAVAPSEPVRAPEEPIVKAGAPAPSSVQPTAGPTTTLPTTAAPVTATAPTNTSSDLKRGADVLGDASGSDAAASSSGPIAPKAKRVRKTREEKLAILAFVDDGGTHVSAAEKFGVSRTAVTKMVKERDIIMSGLSGKQHAAVNGTPQAVSVATAAVSHPPSAGVTNSAMSVTEGAPVPPPARKTRATSATSSTATAAAARAQQAAEGNPHPKAKRVRKTNEEKLLILEFVERGGSQGAAAEKFGVSRTAVTKMVKEREAITAQVMSGKSNHRKVLQYQHKLSIIEDMLYKWQVQVENDAPNLKITGDLLQSKAVEFRDKILTEWKGSLEPEVVQSLSDFKASNGWLHRYLQRRNLRTASKREYHRRQSPNGSGSIPPSPSDPFNISVYLSDITQRLRTVPVRCIWNMDEIALLPKTCAASPEHAADTPPQDRMTIALMVNAAGEKFKPEVLISEAYTEKLDALQKTHPNLSITSQHNAWQDTTALALYLHAVSTEAKQRQETWFIVMDASPSHMEFAHLVDPAGSFEQGFRFENLVLVLLPPQANREHHPIHHGISRVFKAAYRQAMLAALVQKWNDDAKTEGGVPKTSFEIHAQIHAADEMAWISLAWDALPAALIRHCWVRNGLLSSVQLADISQDNSRSVEAELFRSLTDTMTVLTELDNGALAQLLRLPASSPVGATGAQTLPILDRVNALITLDDNEPTERKVEMPTVAPQVITETDANGDLRALV